MKFFSSLKSSKFLHHLSRQSSNSNIKQITINFIRIKYHQIIKNSLPFRILLPISILSMLTSYLSVIRDYNKTVELNIPYDVYKFSMKVSKSIIDELIELKNQNYPLDNVEQITDLLNTKIFDNEYSKLMCEYILQNYGKDILKLLNSNLNSELIFSELFTIIDYSKISERFYNEHIELASLSSFYLKSEWKWRFYNILNR